ncbi:hypothetical protein GVN21_11220 [Caulobacter sp. SLTY]|uniref:hypothetical protein n=1 Tax=Caulobacter sp. SLTY TaxID=2683262 RepID=UPI001412064A|nr:hypothetical protein [Caulobacter sp. SLTY]NBB15925.1 hypothetical protein [Caulobacter sp. SLTY]
MIDLRIRKWAPRLAAMLGRPGEPHAFEDRTLKAIIENNSDADLEDFLLIAQSPKGR